MTTSSSVFDWVVSAVKVSVIVTPSDPASSSSNATLALITEGPKVTVSCVSGSFTYSLGTLQDAKVFPAICCRKNLQVSDCNGSEFICHHVADAVFSGSGDYNTTIRISSECSAGGTSDIGCALFNRDIVIKIEVIVSLKGSRKGQRDI